MDLSFLASPDAWLTLVTLSALEIVLGIDNLVFISIAVGRLPEPQRPLARKIGIAVACITRLLLLVMLVVAIASLATLNFSRSMLYTNEATKIAGGRMQARMCAESGAQAIRLFLAYPPLEREGMGGAWSNSNYFQSRNVLPSATPEGRGNYSVISPALDQDGSYNGIRFGLQNESGKLNLNALVQLDELAQSGSLASSAATGLAGSTGGTGSTGGSGNNSGGGGSNSGGSNSGGSNCEKRKRRNSSIDRQAKRWI